MPGLVAGKDALLLTEKGVDGRDKPGHDACFGRSPHLERSVQLHFAPFMPSLTHFSASMPSGGFTHSAG